MKTQNNIRVRSARCNVRTAAWSYSLLFVVFVCNSLFVTAQSYLWAKSAGGTSHDYVNSAAVDAIGNIVLTGYFYSPSITFGTTTLTNSNPSSGSTDIFIAKYDVSGNELWAKSASGIGWDVINNAVVDPNGNIIVTGRFGNPSITFGSTTLTNGVANTSDIFIVKYDSSGNVLWAKSEGGASWDMGNNAAVDPSGNIIVTGRFYSSTITFGTTTLTNAGDNDIFIVKYDGSGNVLWAKSAGGTSYDEDYSSAVDLSGNIILSGEFRSPSITFGTTTLANTDNTGTTPDIFIVKYDGSGNVLWARSAGGTGWDIGNSLGVDPSGNIILTGQFNSPSIIFGTNALANFDNSGNSVDIFIVKYDWNGNVLWAKDEGGTGDDFGYSAVVASGGNIIVTGGFNSPSIIFGITTLTATTNYSDIFIVKYDGSGNVLWAKGEGGTGDDYGYSTVLDVSGSIIVTGWFQSSSITFGTTTLTNANSGTDDIFIVKLDGLTGAEENVKNNYFAIYPNPTNGEIALTINEARFAKAELTICNMYGGKMYSKQMNDEKNLFLNLDFPDGIYSLQIQTESETISKKLILIR